MFWPAPISSRLGPVFLAAAALLLPCKVQATQSIKLAWDANSEPDLAGYRVYFGTTSGTYTDVRDVLPPSLTLTDLSDGTKYYFAVSAYDTDGAESPLSSEISYTTPGSIPTPTPTPSPTPTPTSTPAPPRQALLNVSTRVHVRSGDSVMIGGFIISGDSNKDVVLRALGPSLANGGVKGPLADPSLELHDSTGTLIAQNDNWTSLPPDTVLPELQPTNPAESVIVINLPPGSYTAILRSANGSTGIALVELYALLSGDSRVVNISTRGLVGTADDAMIGGFIVGDTAPSKVIVRAIGPSLAAAGVAGSLADPVLELHDSQGSLIFQNDNWRSDQEQQIIDSTIPPLNDQESAIVAVLPPGAYTAIVRGVGETTGVALVEAYALSP